MNKKLKEIIEWSMFTSISIAYLFFRLIGRISADIINLKDISGWQMQIRNSGIEGIFELSLITSLIVYLIFDIKRLHRNNMISKLHLVSISICAIIDSFGNIDINIYFSFVICSILLFLINTYLTLKMLHNKVNN
jgi:hypothetical protein